MKKLFVAVLAVAALASCAQEDVILNNDKAISFGDAYVANSTKAIYEGTNYVQAFQVWGTVTPNGDTQSVVLYEGANVTRPAGLAGYNPETPWTCDVQRFWTPNCDYAFYAVVDSREQKDANGKIVPNANVTADKGVPTSIAYTADGQNDLLYGATTKNVGDDASNPGLVAFKMEHLLSKITFKVTNPAKNGDYSYNVKSISVSGAYEKSTYDIAAGTWATGTGAMANLLFGSATGIESGNTHTFDKSFVIIPGKPELAIAIEVQTVFNGTAVGTQTHNLSVNKSGDKTQIDFAKNTHYNFVVALEGGKPIDFTIGSVGPFTTPATGGDVTIQ